MNFWICTAMGNGGILTARQLYDGLYVATMEWPDLGESVVGECQPRLVDALESLDAALLVDAEKEMQEGGSV
jgi:hypothetical protein